MSEKEFIKFPKIATMLFAELMEKHQRSVNDVLSEVYVELGLTERIENSEKSGEIFQLRPDFSGIDIIKEKESKNGKKPGKETK